MDKDLHFHAVQNFDSLDEIIQKFSVGDPAGVAPQLMSFDSLCQWMHEEMKPWQDSVGDIKMGVSHAFVNGGSVWLALQDKASEAPDSLDNPGPKCELVGVLVLLKTGMRGFIPENCVLFVCVRPSARGMGIGRRLLDLMMAATDGPIKLHVEYENPAKRLYERIGFKTKYAEMRLDRPHRHNDVESPIDGTKKRKVSHE